MGGLPGADRAVVAAVVDGSGNLCIGGTFTVVGDIEADFIAKWDGSSWSALGEGMNDWVNALAVSGSDLYAGGRFTTAGGVTANHIAKWDGSGWSALDEGIGGGEIPAVWALAISGNDLYAGGFFTTAGVVTANSIAKWDGSSWSALGLGMNDWVNALAVSGSDLYAAGSFTTAGGKVSAYLARAFLDSVPPLEVVNGRATVFFREGIEEGLYEIYRSTELNDWELIATRYAGATGGIDFVDENSPEFKAFYRAVRVVP